MLEMGFLPDIQRVLSQPNMPKKGDKQMLMFSATFKDEIQLVAQVIFNPILSYLIV